MDTNWTTPAQANQLNKLYAYRDVVLESIAWHMDAKLWATSDCHWACLEAGHYIAEMCRIAGMGAPCSR